MRLAGSRQIGVNARSLQKKITSGGFFTAWVSLVAVGEDASDELVEEVFSDSFGKVDNASHLGDYIKALGVFSTPVSG